MSLEFFGATITSLMIKVFAEIRCQLLPRLECATVLQSFLQTRLPNGWDLASTLASAAMKPGFLHLMKQLARVIAFVKYLSKRSHIPLAGSSDPL